MSAPISISIETSLASFQSTLERYMLLVNKLPDEVLEKKGRDLGIKLYQGFRNVRWKGKGIAFREFRRRVRDDVGTLVRQRYLTGKWKVPLEQKVLKRGEKSGRDKRDFYPTSLWQRLVAQELLRRQAGQGMLAASFLWFRRRSSQAKGTYFVRNKTGKTLGYVEKGDGYLAIVGVTEGLARVDARYGVVTGALAGAEADMMVYIQRKEEALRSAVLGVAA